MDPARARSGGRRRPGAARGGAVEHPIGVEHCEEHLLRGREREGLPERGAGLGAADGGGGAKDSGDDAAACGGGVERLDADLQRGGAAVHRCDGAAARRAQGVGPGAVGGSRGSDVLWRARDGLYQAR